MSYKLEAWPAQTFDFNLPMRYTLWGPKDRGVVVCLHGYQDHALSMMKRIGWWEHDLPFQVLAVNAPFPVPICAAGSFHEAYAWYFRDTDRGFTIISPEQTARRVADLISNLNLADTPSVVFGFSQGGYLAPFLASHLIQMRALIGLGSGYPFEPYKKLHDFALYALHGEQDERIPLSASREAHARLVPAKFAGEFISVPKLTHRVDPLIEPLVRTLVLKHL